MEMKSQQTERLLTPAEMAKVLGVAEQTLANWRCQNRGPRYVKLGSGRSAHIRYLPTQHVEAVS